MDTCVVELPEPGAAETGGEAERRAMLERRHTWRERRDTLRLGRQIPADIIQSVPKTNTIAKEKICWRNRCNGLT